MSDVSPGLVGQECEGHNGGSHAVPEAVGYDGGPEAVAALVEESEYDPEDGEGHDGLGIAVSEGEDEGAEETRAPRAERLAEGAKEEAAEEDFFEDGAENYDL